MGRRAIELLLIVLVAGGMLSCRGCDRRRSNPLRTASSQASRGSLPDQLFDPLRAANHAPDGKTHCESAYLGLQAFVAAHERRAKEAGEPAPFARVPSREEHESVCSSLPEAEQRCLVPKLFNQQAGCEAVVDRLKANPDYRTRLYPQHRSRGEGR
jgi:hypothetical protein